MSWTKGRGLLGPLQPLVGQWATAADAAGPRCTRNFTPFGKAWLMLDARWEMGPERVYRESAFYGAGEGGGLGFFSFTNDGKSAVGRLADGSDVDPQAITFEAQMPAGLARMIYWPLPDGAAGFHFAVESRTKKGWNRFLTHRYVPLTDQPT